MLQPIGKGIAHAWEEGTEEGLKLLGEVIVWFFASDEPISESDWNPDDGVPELRREFQIVNGKAGVKIDAAEELREVIVQIWKWESEPHAKVIIQQPGASPQIVVKRFDHSGENVWHQIKYDTTAHNTPFKRKRINGNWRITIPGQFYGASLLLTVSKKGE